MHPGCGPISPTVHVSFAADVWAIFPVVVHVVSAPDTEANAREQGVAVYLSYQFHQGTEQKV
jgi:hypothetical protein